MKRRAKGLEMTLKEASSKQQNMFEESWACMNCESVEHSRENIKDYEGKLENKHKKLKNHGIGSGWLRGWNSIWECQMMTFTSMLST